MRRVTPPPPQGAHGGARAFMHAPVLPFPCNPPFLGGFKESATKGQFGKCGLTVVSNYDPNKNKARVCNKLWHQTINLFKLTLYHGTLISCRPSLPPPTRPSFCTGRARPRVVPTARLLPLREMGGAPRNPAPRTHLGVDCQIIRLPLHRCIWRKQIS